MLKKTIQYLHERYPIVQFVPLCFFIVATISLGVNAYSEEVSINNFLISFFALFLFLLRLRFFDEFKDFEHDVKYYPNRPVSRGLISLKEIGILTIATIILEIILASLLGLNSVLFFAIAFGYSLLLFKEFFIANWLKKHFTTYILSHEILLIPLFFYLFSINGLSFAELKESFYWLLCGFLSFQFFLLEVARKVRPKSLEIASRDTYTAQYGLMGASLLVIFLALGALMFQALIEYQFLILNWLFVLSILAFLFLLLRTVIFVDNSNKRNSKMIFLSAVAFFVLLNSSFAINLLFLYE